MLGILAQQVEGQGHGAAGGLGGFFPPLIMGIVKDSTGEFVLGFVFLVAFAWLCAGLATGVAGPPEAEAEAGGGDRARSPQPVSGDGS